MIARVRGEQRALALPRDAAAEALESGSADLAVDYFSDLQRAGLFQQRLFRNEHIFIVRRDHPAISNAITLKQFLAASYAVVRPDGREHVFEQFLHPKGLQRRVRLEVAHFMSLLPIIPTSELIATVPRDLVLVCVRYGHIHMLDTPMKSPVIEVRQLRHRRFHKDAAHVWQRGILHRLLTHA